MNFETLRNPGPEWRAKPFWALNDELDESGIRAQINTFKEMGFGGYFMHSRVGLKTPFLGAKWFDMIAAGIDEGKRTGLETWIYDEDRWPSGTAGGLVTLDHRCRAKRLHCLRTKGDSIPDGALAVFKYALRDGGLASYEKINPWAAGRDEDVLVFVARTGFPNDNNMGFYNGMTYIDTLSKHAVARFLDAAYAPYLRFKDEFGKGVKGVFTDEPNRGPFLATPYDSEWEREGSQYQIPWTANFAAEFEKRMGYGLVDRLPEVFFNLAGEARSKVRYDASEVTAQLFIEAFTEQVAAWCGKHGLELTGHYLGEDNLYMLNWACGVVDRFYEPMSVPGIDLIGGAVEYMVPKQVQSAARQFGKKWTMCEMYAHSGWGYRFQQYKSYGEWNTVFGINLRCPHLSLYSLAGQRKRDCPPTISFQQAWHKDYRAVEDHFARLGVAVTEGEPLCSLLVVHPVDATSGVLLPGWAKHMPWNDCTEPYWEYEKSFKALTRALMGAQVDFDVSEEAMIEKHACVKMINGAVKLVMGRMAYDCVAVPPLVSMRGRVASLLAGFAAAGGRVLFAEKPVSVVDFKDDARFAGFPAFKNTPESVASALTCHGTTRVFGLGSFDILAMHRRNENADMLLLVNTRLDAAFDGSVRVASTGQVQLFDTLTCERREVPSEQKNNETHFTLHLSKGGSALLFIASKPEALPALDPRARVETHRFEGPFDVSLDSPNILLLDRPKFRVENGPEGEAQILRVDDAVRDHLGFERRSRVMYQPWFKKTFLADNPRRCRVALDYAFVVEHLPEGDLFLCLEQPDSHALAVNGTPLAQEDCGHFADSCVRKLRVPLSLLKPGENRITSVCDFTEEVDLESMYLMGGFGVRREENNSFMTPPVKRLALGDITAQGLPHYAGTVTYHMAAPEDGTLFCDGFKGIAVRVRQGGVKPKLLPFEPYETEVRAGVLAIELICTMGNAFGNERPGRQGNPIEPQGLFTAPRLAR